MKSFSIGSLIMLGNTANVNDCRHGAEPSGHGAIGSEMDITVIFAKVFPDRPDANMNLYDVEHALRSSR